MIFLLVIGVPENEAKAFVGSHWTLKVGFNDKKVCAQMECEEFPALNLFIPGAEEGKEFTTPDKGFGKSSMVFTSVPGESNKVHTVQKTERFGTHEITETYSEEGVKMVNNLRYYSFIE